MEERTPYALTPPPYPYPPPYMVATDEDEISLYELWLVIWRGKWFIIFITLLATIVAATVAIKLPNIYRAEVVLEPVEEEKGGGLAALAGQFGGLASLAGVDLGGSGGSAHATNVLQTRQFMVQFIEDNQLKPHLFPEHWDSEQQQWLVKEPGVIGQGIVALKVALMGEESVKPVNVGSESLAEGEPTLQQSYEIFAKWVQVNEDKKSGLIRVAVEGEDPRLTAVWANGLIDKLREVLREETMTRARENISYLEQELARTTIEESRQMLFSLMRGHIKNLTLASASDNFAFQVIDPAVIPEKKSKPKRSLIVVLGTMLGGMAALFILFIRNAVRNIRAKPKEALTDAESS
ncbi:LPS O-antigen length regulator [Ectothiorhodospiraceae bacterium BW-2]|nr:LPS O-antigen length regulator [Ectothiorhodospiraceae bacterium BW-2]